MRYLLLAVLISFFSCNEQKVNRLKGAWQVREIHWMTPDTIYSIEKAQPGFLIVSDSMYSFIWTPINEKRKAFKELGAPTKEEMIYGFQTLVFNAGTYVKTDSTFAIKALIAKVPGFEGGEQYFEYAIAKDTLKLKMIDETYPSGEKPAWYGQLQTQFILMKFDY